MYEEWAQCAVQQVQGRINAAAADSLLLIEAT